MAYKEIIYDAQNKPLVRSKNLAGVIRYLGKGESPVRLVTASKRPDGSAELRIRWENDAHYRTDFASFNVLLGWLEDRRNLQGERYEAHAAGQTWRGTIGDGSLENILAELGSKSANVPKKPPLSPLARKIPKLEAWEKMPWGYLLHFQKGFTYRLFAQDPFHQHASEPVHGVKAQVSRPAGMNRPGGLADIDRSGEEVAKGSGPRVKGFHEALKLVRKHAKRYETGEPSPFETRLGADYPAKVPALSKWKRGHQETPDLDRREREWTTGMDYYIPFRSQVVYGIRNETAGQVGGTTGEFSAWVLKSGKVSRIAKNGRIIAPDWAGALPTYTHVRDALAAIKAHSKLYGLNPGAPRPKDLEGIACGAPYGKLSSRERKMLPKEVYGLPRVKKYPMPDSSHAKNAKARASFALRRGEITRGQFNQINRKADRIIAMCSRATKRWDEKRRGLERRLESLHKRIPKKGKTEAWRKRERALRARIAEHRRKRPR